MTAASSESNSESGPKLVLSDDQWRERLNPQEFAVLRRAGTERPFTGEYTDTKTEGVYACRACGAELFRSTEKFESHCGWPSFFDPADSEAVILRSDDSLGMRRVEVLCANCHSHLGHVFEGEGYPDADGSALLHQLDLAAPRAVRFVAPRPAAAASAISRSSRTAAGASGRAVMEALRDLAPVFRPAARRFRRSRRPLPPA